MTPTGSRYSHFYGALGTWVCLGILLGCGTDYVDVGGLSKHDQELFHVAAQKEGVAVTTSPEFWDWVVRYDWGMRHVGYSQRQRIGNYCEIRINPSRLKFCGTGSTDGNFIQIMRHEIRHCQGRAGHLENPDRLMYRKVPCDPID